MDLALVDLEALRGESFGDIGSGDGAEELVVLAGLAGEAHGDAIDEGRLLLRGFKLGGSLLGQRGANALERFHVAGGGFDGELVRQQEIAGVAGLDGDDVATVAEFFDVFLQNDLHFLYSRFLNLFRGDADRAEAGPLQLKRPTQKAAATCALAAMSVPRLKIALCLHLNPALQKG